MSGTRILLYKQRTVHSRHCRLPHCHQTHQQQHRNIISIMLTRVSILVEGLDLLIRVSQAFGRGHQERSLSTEHVTRRPNPCCLPNSRTHVEMFISVTRTDLSRCGWMRLQAGVVAIKRAIRFHSFSMVNNRTRFLAGQTVVAC